MIRFVVFDNDPWVLINETNNGIELYGEFKHLFEYVVRSLNLKWELKVPDIQGSGTEISPGNWTGALGMLFQNKADVIFQPFGVDEKRFSVADFTSSFAATHYSVLSSNKRNTQDSMFFSFDTIQLQVWLVLGAFLISVSLIFYWTDEIENILRGQKNQPRNPYNLLKYLYIFTAVLISKAVNGCHSRTLGRHLLIFSWSYGVVIFAAAISSSIISRLTMTNGDEKIDQLTDIVKYPLVTPIAVRDTVALEYIKNSADENVQLLWRQITRYDGRVSIKEFESDFVAQKVIKGNAVLISNVEILNDIARKHCAKAHFHLAKEGFLSVFVTMMIRRDLPRKFKEDINLRVLRYVDVGLMIRAWEPPLKQNITVCNSNANEQGPLCLKDLLVSFRTWLTGAMTSFGLLIIESVYFVLKMENNSRNRNFSARCRITLM